MGERQEAPPCSGPLEPGALRDLGDRHARMFLIEGFDDRKPFDQPIDEVTLAHAFAFRHLCEWRTV